MLYKDAWLSDEIGKNVYQLKICNFSEKVFLKTWKKFRAENANESYLVYSKISTNSMNIIHCLDKANFKLIDTNVQFELNNNKLSDNQQKNDLEICYAENKYKQDLEKIAKDNFHYSRFHLDPLIDNDIANQIKQNWVKSYFFGKRGDKMLMALLNKRPVGFLQLIVKEKELIIDLICVDKKAQGSGVASSLIKFARGDIKRSFIKAGTQIGNLPSINLYQRLGFVMARSDYVFHYHS
jgi:ribosomal protein S18 acetylase RimI-like enzyme